MARVRLRVRITLAAPPPNETDQSVSFPTNLRASGAITNTTGNATTQLLSQAPPHKPKNPSTGPTELSVDTPETMPLILIDRIRPNNNGAYFAGIMV